MENNDNIIWKEFKIKDIFPKIQVSKYSSKPVESGDIPFVSSSSVNNGVSLFTSEQSFSGQCITVSTNGRCFDCFYHCGPIAISTDVELLTNNHLNENNALFVCSILNRERFKWSYGRKPKNDKVFETTIKLPVKNEYPDWDYMSNYIQSIKSKYDSISLDNMLKTNNESRNSPLKEKPIQEWKLFKVSYIFKPFINGKGLTEQEIIDNPGNLAAVQSSSENNAVMGYIDEEYCKEKGYKIVYEPCLTVARSGSAGFVSYQEKGCIIGDSAKALILDIPSPNKYHYLFIRTILMANYYKFAYGRKVRIEQYMNMDLLLPSKNNEPDWDFMESYIKSLPYADRI